MKLGIKASSFVAVLFIITGCTYDFSEDYFKELNPVNPNLNIVLTGFMNGQETNSSRTVEYVISGAGNENFEMTVKVDDYEIHHSNEQRGEFYLYIDDLDEGTHTLTIDFTFSSNTGSLASTAGGEFFAASAEYNFVIDKSLADSFGIASVKIEQGSIYINLNPVTNDNFEEAYLVIKNEDGYVSEERLISPQDLTDLVIHDNLTKIYNPSFAIKVKNPFTEQTSDFVFLPTPKMELAIVPLDYKKFKLINTAHPLYGNFETLKAIYYDIFSTSFSYVLNPQGGETIIDQSFYFGTEMMVMLEYYRDGYLIRNSAEYVSVGKSMPISQFEEVTYISSLNKYFVLDITPANDLIIYKLNAQSMEVENSQTIARLDFSGDFKSIERDPSTNFLIINMNKRALIFNPGSFSIVKTYRASDFNSQKAHADVYYRGDYIVLEEGWPSGELLIYEKSTGIKKFGVSKTTKFFSAVDASFLYVNGGLYKLNSGNFTLLNKVRDPENNRDAPALDFMVFDKQSNSAVYGWQEDTYYLNLNTNTPGHIWGPAVVYDVKYTDKGMPLINSHNNARGSISHIYNAGNNENRMIGTYGGQSFRYFNGVLFSPNGFYLESDLYTNQ